MLKIFVVFFVVLMVEMYIVKVMLGVKRSGSVEYLFIKCFFGKFVDCKFVWSFGYVVGNWCLFCWWFLNMVFMNLIVWGWILNVSFLD